MIIVRLMGGLGNQMFQYAAGRALALQNSTSLKLDLDWFNNRPTPDTARTYMLWPFGIVSEFATKSEILNMQNHVWYRQRYFQYDPDVLNLGANVYLDGFWQSPQFFDDYIDQIQNEFKFTTSLNKENIASADKISSTLSVAVHIRRGDYVNNPETRKFHHSCTLSYYRKAMEYFTDRFDNITFFVFSDDPEWSRANLRINNSLYFITNNKTENAFFDLYLLSLCKHHIIANSTFSWWGAWLGKNKGQIVILPNKWFNDPSVDTSNLILPGWIILT